MLYEVITFYFVKIFFISMSSKISQHIFTRIKSGDETAFNELFDEYYTPLCFFANKYLKDLDLSRSLVQQVFVDIWMKREKISIIHSVKSYLYNSVKNKSIDYIRSQKQNVQITDVVEENMQTPFKDLIAEAELNKLINESINELV